MKDPDYEAMIRSACVQIALECQRGNSVTGPAEWLLTLSRDRDKLRKKANVIPLRRYFPQRW